ncbi:MAG TPA: BatA and WFA domain-containing protein [Polyangia bacterium]|nr:BatA and WFA domain-containing protein [Polyangia bacterium]
MQFGAPSLLLGLLAAAIPWLVHLIGKRRATPVKFAAMQLLLRSERRVSARRRLREILLLLARTATAASLPLIFARPFTERAADVPAASLDSQSAVILLDDSASLRRARGGGALFDVAKDKARSLARQFPSDSEVAVVLSSVGSNAPLAELNPERSRVLQAIEAVSCSARPADFTAAMRRAALILANSPRQKRRIFLITDLQSAGWEDGAGLPESNPPEVVVLDVAPAAWENRAVVEVKADPAPEGGPGGVAVTAEMADFSTGGVTGLGVALKIDGQVVSKGFVDIPAGGRAKKRFLHTLPAGSGSAHEVEIEIDPDAFRLDNRRMVHLELARALRGLVINGDARTVDKEDEPYFLERALKAGDHAAVLTTVVPDDVPLDALPSYTVVFVLNVAQPSQPLAQALTHFVEGGGGLFLSMGSRVEASAWNERLAQVLPQPLTVVRTQAALPGQNAGETIDDRPAERLAPVDRRHPLLASFPAQGDGLSSARFFKYMLLEPVPDSGDRSVVLRFESGAPALVERSVGKGRVLLLATTVDREWTDLPIRPGFLPLVRESARRLVGGSDNEVTPSILVGQTRELALAAEDRRLEITKPDGSVWVAKHERPGIGRTVAFADTDEPGVYRVAAAGPDGALNPRPADGFVVNVDVRESNPTRLAPDKRPDRVLLAATGGQPPKHKVELWHALAGALIAFVLLESLLTLRWRRTVLAETR